ncbi:hypothetical protein HWQ46_01830 [Shewanella sp. D64]|uniref:hypothetical protein n=1 Tax=unclassified Shewanella TaxID=196818 RepID=UPI0022BA4900|nr:MULTISPECIES: hypothetical protein [unclassified Shewanella]MEC4724287.1 hypothetical protein [Shewanella sp. D64]MEC4738799.1 hypothetical protein [Shewanella sp. E94]WBJ97762.1 hypothetical protein HWQ47_12025 [Shewanella sp. MTB7]
MNVTVVGIHNVAVSLVEEESSKPEIDNTSSTSTKPSSSEDSVTLSSEAISLLELEVNMMGNGSGNEPPSINKPLVSEIKGNGSGNEPPN